MHWANDQTKQVICMIKMRGAGIQNLTWDERRFDGGWGGYKLTCVSGEWMYSVAILFQKFTNHFGDGYYFNF